MSELVKGRASCQMAVLPKVRFALFAARKLSGEGPTDVEDAPAPER